MPYQPKSYRKFLISSPVVETKKYKVIANDDLYTFPHSWTKGLDYEVIEKDNYFSLSSNEGQLNYVNDVKEEVLKCFTLL